MLPSKYRWPEVMNDMRSTPLSILQGSPPCDTICSDSGRQGALSWWMHLTAFLHIDSPLVGNLSQLPFISTMLKYQIKPSHQTGQENERRDSNMFIKSFLFSQPLLPWLFSILTARALWRFVYRWWWPIYGFVDYLVKKIADLK